MIRNYTHEDRQRAGENENLVKNIVEWVVQGYTKALLQTVINDALKYEKNGLVTIE